MELSFLRIMALSATLAIIHAVPAPASAQYVIGMDNDKRDQVEPREWAEGDHVFVNRKGDNWWYPATISGKAGPDYSIDYGSGGSGQASPVHIAHPRLLAGKMVEVKHPRLMGEYAKARVIEYARNRGVARVILRPGSSREFELLPSNFRVPTDAIVPPPPPKPPFASPVTVCNANAETVHFALHFYLFAYAGVSKGWWSVAPGQCEVVDLAEQRRDAGFDPDYGDGEVYIYGETDGILGGAIKKAWPRKVATTDGRGRDVKRHCIGNDPDRPFVHRSGPRSPTDRTQVSAPRCVSIYQMEWMANLRADEQGHYAYTFEGE